MSPSANSFFKTKGDRNKKEAKKTIKAYQAGQVWAAERLLELYGGIIAIAAKTFANKDLAGSIDPKNLGQLHKSAAAGSLGIFRPGLDRRKYEELKTNLVIKLLDDALKQRPIKNDPFAWAKTVAWNYCRDLADREKVEFKRCPPKPKWAKKSGDSEDDIIEGAPDLSTYIPGRDEPLMDNEEIVPPQQMHISKLESLYDSLFTDDFRHSIQTSLELIASIYDYKRELTTPSSRLSKFHRAQLAMEATEKKFSSVFRIKKGVWALISRRGNPFENLYSDESIRELSRVREGADIYFLEKFTKALNEAKAAINEEILLEFHPDLFVLFREGPATREDLDLLSVSPARMMFDIWKKTNETKRGKKGGQNSLLKMRILFWFKKRWSVGTEYEYLFERINDDKDIDNLRKYHYRRSRRNKAEGANRRLVETIYKKSFVDKIDLEDDFWGGNNPMGPTRDEA